MARKLRSGLETRAARLKRPVAKKPEFVKIGLGIGLGYRRNATAGTWVVRVADGNGANWTKAIGLADDYADANGLTVFDYWQAQDRARAAARVGKGGKPAIEDRPPSLREALDQYEADLKTRGADVGNAVRVRRHLSERLLDKHVADLTLNDLRMWRDGLTSKARRKSPIGIGEGAEAAGGQAKNKNEPAPGPLAPSGVNRLCAAMKAALNLAADRDGRITSRRPWEQGLATLPNAEESRNVILPDADIRKLVGAAQSQGPWFGLLVEGLASTGARVSQLARVNVGDMQDGRSDPRFMMPSSRKGNGKKTILRRPVPISAHLAERLRKTAEGKPADAPLFVKPSGERWSDSDHSRLFARVVKIAEVAAGDGAVITIGALRHSSIVRQLLANVPVRVVAALHDTSVAMIERTYSRYIADHTDTMARAAMFSATIR